MIHFEMHMDTNKAIAMIVGIAICYAVFVWRQAADAKSDQLRNSSIERLRRDN